ncbi:MAG: roadblock/LC7 domain-containing protein [Syntrophotaleaceae bacterium]
MPFKHLLTELLERIPGALGAIIADWEGEAVDHVARMDDYELRVIGAHKGIILSNLRRVLEQLGRDRLQEVIISTSRSRTLVLPVTEDYFLVVTADRDVVLGRALFESRRCVARLKKEIA